MTLLPPTYQEELDALLDTITGDKKAKKAIADYFANFYESLSQGAQSVGAKTTPHHIEDLDHLTDQLCEGQTIGELLNFSPHEIQIFYKNAYQKLQNGDYESAKNGFVFLVALCPVVYDFWLCLSLSLLNLKEYQAALDAANRVVELAPHNSDGYLCKIRVLCEQGAVTHALHFIHETDQFAYIHSREPWAKELIELCQHAKEKVKQWRK